MPFNKIKLLVNENLITNGDYHEESLITSPNTLNTDINHSFAFDKNFGVFNNKSSFDKATETFYFKSNETNPTEITKLFMPKPFVASPSNIYHGLPWFLDYVHLSFWFFYFSIMISFLFLIYFFSFIWNNQENKYPVRETRGFSRAQVGDTMTAIVPLTWSITMLLHASTHSSNFDENTTGTQFCLTVVAYQWGWNYYYPKDIISMFNTTPIKVGHNNVDYYTNFSSNYDYLLELSRQDIINKNLLLGIGSSKTGKNNIQSIQSLYLKPFSINQNMELPTSLFINPNTSKISNTKLKSLTSDVTKVIQLLDESSLNYTYFNNESFFDNFNNLNSLNNLNYNTFIFNLLNKFLSNSDYTQHSSFFFSSLRSNFFFNNVTSFNDLLNQQSKNNFFNKQFFSDSILKVKSMDSHRNKNTFFTNSNKFFLLYNNLFNQNEKFDNSRIAENLKSVEYSNIAKKSYQRMLKSLDINSSNNEFELLKYNDVDYDCLSKFNVIVNQWLMFRKLSKFFINQNSWLNQTYSNLCLNNNLHNFFLNSYKNINFCDNSINLYYVFFNNKNISNFNLIQQSFNYNSADNSFLHFNNSLVSFEDFGFSSSSAVKEFWYKNFLFSKFSYFSILNFYKKNFSSCYLKKNYFLFLNNNFLLGNYKIWELDFDILSFSNLFFQENPFFKNLSKLNLDYNLSHQYLWPIYMSNLSKNYNNIFLSYNSISNLLNYNFYAALKNFYFIRKNVVGPSVTVFYLNKQPTILTLDVVNNFNFKLEKSQRFLFYLELLQYSTIFYNCILQFNLINARVRNLNVLKSSKKNVNAHYLTKSVNIDFLKKIRVLPLSGYPLLFNSVLVDNLFCFNTIGAQSFFCNLAYCNILKTILITTHTGYWDLFFKNSNNYNMFNSEKPIRVSLKSNDPIVFNFKLLGDVSNIFYTNKTLFYWQSQWSTLIKNFHLPLYKFFKGGIEKKEYSGFWDFKNINDHHFDLNIIHTNDFTISKTFIKHNYKFNKIKNFYYKDNYFLFLLDSEKFSFLKNFIHFLPNTNEDLDITYINKIWTFDINSSRRNDHLSKFKVFWGPLFLKYIKKLTLSKNYKLLESQSIKNINFFKNFSSNCLNFESFYLQNISLQKNSYIVNLKIFSRYSNLKINFLKNNFFWNFNILNLTSISEIKRISLITNYYKNSNSWYFYENNLLHHFLDNNNFLNFWSQLWLFKDNLQNYQNKLFLNKNFKESFDFLNKFFLINSFKERETKSIVEWSNFNYGLLDYSNSNMLGDIYNILTLYQNNFDIKNNSIAEKSMSSLFHSNLNILKYYNLSSNKNFINSIKTVYFNYYLLQLQKINKNKFEFKEVNNNHTAIRRLRVSKGICLPSDFSIHVICGSKDVIHSWAIPGLGIKIDCIPGFNSHRRVTFRWRGVYWGQCMEVCGRYHHWMPILIRIVHKDLFLVWCLSFLRMLNNKNFKHDKTMYNEILLLNWSNDSSNFNLFDSFFNEVLNSKNAEERLLFVETMLV